MFAKRIAQRNNARVKKSSSRYRGRFRRALVLERLEDRRLLAANDLSVVPFWDGETSGPPDALQNRFGGNPIAGNAATLSFETTTVHSGAGAFRIDTNGPIAPGGFDFVGTAFTGFGPSSAYVDTRDVTNFDGLSVWVKNETLTGFRFVFEIKDFRDSNDHRARFPVNVSSSTAWAQISVPLDLGAPGWTVIGSPDLARAKVMAFVIEATAGTVNGEVFLDDLVLTENGGALDPQTASFETILNRIGERQFRGLWGSRDRDTGLVPANSSFADVMALNSTAGLLQVLPSAIELGWVGQAEADAYVDVVVSTLNDVIDNVKATGNGGFIPPRYIDRVQLTPNFVAEESPVDAAFVFLAMYQYQTLPTTSPTLMAAIDGLLGRFDFASFSAPSGWSLAYVYDTASFTPGTYDGYSTEIYVMSLAAHLAENNHVDIATQWNSGVNRTLASLVDPAESHLVHSQTEFRAPFLQWLFHLFADVSERGDDTFPDPQLRRNPYWNAVLYQREAMQKLADLGRPTFAQPDASDDGTGTTYEQFSLYNDFGQPDLFMPWSATFGLSAELPSAETAIRDLLSRDLHGPLGISDAAVWATGAGAFSRLPARQDFWNIALSTMAITNQLTGSNADFAQVTEVSAAIERVLPERSLTLPVPESLTTFRNWVTFTPTNYNPNINQFPSEASIEADLRRLYDAGFRGLITYTMDGTLREVPRIAKQVGFDSVIAGIFWFDAAQLERERTATMQELAEDPTYIDGLVVGNEGLFEGRYTRPQLETEIAWFSSNTGKPVTTTETGGQYLNDPTLMDLGDWVFPNIQPFCAGIFDPAQGATHVSNEFLAIQNTASLRIPGRITVVKEAWWPSAGHANGTEDHQSEFLRQLYESPTLFAWGESSDQTWKSVGECSGAGPNWGLYEEDRMWKAVIPQRHTHYTDLYPGTTDFGDAPDPSFPTLLASDGARHVLGSGLFMGATVDPESDGQPNPTATGDDLNGNNDDDGVTILGTLVPGQFASFTIDASGTGFVDAWIDVDGDGAWSHPDEQFFVSESVAAGRNDFTRLVPADAAFGTTALRFRISSVGGLSPTGAATDGEVEDYQATIETVNRFVVNAIGDLGDNDPGDGVCDTGGVVGSDAECTLRAAIDESNAIPNLSPGPDVIVFDIAASGPHTITPVAAFPAVTDAVVIDGTTESDFAGTTPVIELDGTGAGAGTNGLTISAGSSTVRGLTINRFLGSGILLAGGGDNIIQQNSLGTNPSGNIDQGNASHGVIVFNSANNTLGGETQDLGNVISGNDIHGVLITGVGSTGNDVKGNAIGLGADGFTSIGNGGIGVRIGNGASHNDIGGSGNVISANSGSGVVINGGTTTNNAVSGNLIGTDIGGTIDRGNGGSGVVIAGAPDNKIGVAGDGNVISGNAADGITISGVGATGNSFESNLIGLDGNGTTALGNDEAGIDVFDAPNNTIGGQAVGAGNVISGNGESGVFIVGANAVGNRLEGNFVGTDSAALAPVPNTHFGVVFRDAPNNTLGGTVAAARNVVSGNALEGVAVIGNDATGNVISGNFIGTDVSGTADLGNGRTGVLIWKAPGNRVGGTTAGERNIISGNDLFGVRVATSQAPNNVIQGNFIGTDVTGTVDLGNSDSGVHLSNALNTTVGGVNPEEGNLISGNDNHGIVLTGAGVHGVEVQGNLIGTDVTGTTALGNTNVGVRVGTGAHDNTIGGPGASDGNVISANGAEGVLVIDAGTHDNTVSGNLIGTDVAGTAGLGNTGSGVAISGADHNTIGGATPNERNLISGNGLFGVSISGITATGNLVQGNAIGTDATGTTALGNGSTGVFVSAPSNIAGGTLAGEGNLISANGFGGVRLSGVNTTNNLVQGNLIGTQQDGTTPLGNTGIGVRVDNAWNNTIGGMAAGAGNVIAHNTSHAVAVIGVTAINNAIQGNSTFSNGGLGIDLNLDGFTSNDTPAGDQDVDTGPNNLQNFPVLTSAELDGGGNLVIDYAVPSTTVNSAYSLTIEFFEADASNAEGRTKLGQDTYAAGDALGMKQVTVAAGGLVAGNRIVATATDASGNTSEFSANIAVTEAGAGEASRSVSQWQNPDFARDVNGDSFVSPVGDVLPIFNELRHRTLVTSRGELPKSRDGATPFWDVNGDGYVTHFDALQVINYLNDEPTAEGEAMAWGGAGDVAVANEVSRRPARASDLAIMQLFPPTVSNLGSPTRPTSPRDSHADARSQSESDDLDDRISATQSPARTKRLRSHGDALRSDEFERDQTRDKIMDDVFDTWHYADGTDWSR